MLIYITVLAIYVCLLYPVSIFILEPIQRKLKEKYRDRD